MKDQTQEKIGQNQFRSRKSEDSRRPRNRREVSLPLRRPTGKSLIRIQSLLRPSLAQPQSKIPPGKEWMRTSPKIGQNFQWDRGLNVNSLSKIKREEFMVEGNKIDKKEPRFRIKNGDRRNLEFFERSGIENAPPYNHPSKKKSNGTTGPGGQPNYQPCSMPQMTLCNPPHGTGNYNYYNHQHNVPQGMHAINMPNSNPKFPSIFPEKITSLGHNNYYNGQIKGSDLNNLTATKILTSSQNNHQNQYGALQNNSGLHYKDISQGVNGNIISFTGPNVPNSGSNQPQGSPHGMNSAQFKEYTNYYNPVFQAQQQA